MRAVIAAVLLAALLVAPPAGGQSPAPPPDWGLLRLEVEPGSASLYVDGQPVGALPPSAGAPWVVSLPPGPHRIDLVRPGSRALAAILTIRRAETTVLRAALPPEAPPATMGSGYEVVPRFGEEPAADGYQVVPAP